MSDSDPSPGRETAARDDPVSLREPAGDEQAPNTLFNALIGGLVTAITAFFVPLSPVVGGGVAGYLEGGETGDGLRVGALSGLIALLPLFLFGLVAFFFVGVIVPPRGAVGVAFFAFLVLLLGAVYTVGLGALGGAIGVYVKNEL